MSPQTNYDQAMSRAVPGLQVDGRHDNHAVSGAAEEIVRFGLAVVRKSDDADVFRLPGANQAVILDDGGTWTAGNVVSVVNGVTVTTAFATDKATSMAAHATAIQALGFITSATYVGGSNTITIVAAADVYVSTTFDVSGITGTMTLTSITYSSTDELMGLSIREVKTYSAIRQTWSDQAVMTLSGDALNTADTVDGVINGVAIATVTYATSEANTLQLVANAIKAIAGVSDAVVNATARTITIYNTPGLEVEPASLTVTDNALVTTAPSFAATYSQQASPLAVTEAAYLPTETVGAMRRGSVYCRAEEALALGDSVYMRVATGSFAQRGAFRNDADSGTCQLVSALRFAGPTVTDPDGNRIVPVELNLP